MSAIMSNPNPSGRSDIKIAASILKRATHDDTEAIVSMFRQFIPEEEKVYFAQYMGLQGLWGIGTREFACLTDRRVADITVGRFGEVTYQDGYLEHINSCVIYQPSKLGLYMLIGVTVIFTLGLGLLILPLLVQSYYRVNKCGVVLSVRHGIPVYIFTSRRLLTRANALLRLFAIGRENRLKLRGAVP